MRRRTAGGLHQAEPVRPARADKVVWFLPGQADANDTEVLFFAYLLVANAETVEGLNNWAKRVVAEKAEAYEHKATWKPKAGEGGWSMHNKVSMLYEPMRQAYTQVAWPAELLDAIGVAMQVGDFPGKFEGLRWSHMRTHLKSKEPLLGTPVGRNRPPPRWRTWQIVDVAALVLKHGVEMRKLLKLDVAIEDVPTAAELLAAAESRVEELEEEMVEVKRERVRLQNNHHKAVIRLATKSEEKRAAVAKAKAKVMVTIAAVNAAVKAKAVKTIKKEQALVRALKKKISMGSKRQAKLLNQQKSKTRDMLRSVRADAKRKFGEISASAAQQAAAAVGEKMEKLKQLKASAHSEKRHWKRRAENAEHLAETRLKSRRIAEQIDAESEDEGDLDANSKLASSKLASMPTWQKTRGEGSGKGSKGYEPSYRVAIYSQHANGTPPSAIGQNIVTTVKLTAPWLEPKPPSARMLTRTRFELRTIEEALSARKVAGAYRVRQLGMDDTTKFGLTASTASVVVEPEEGAPLEPVILRAAYCSTGGTAELTAAAVESKCFARLRDVLRRWKAKFDALYPGEAWTGPAAEQLSLARLAGGGAIISDTCNTARCTRRVLNEMIATQKKNEIGLERWNAMGEAEQAAAVRVHELDCWQHLRNIFLSAQSTAMSKHVAEELQPQLATFFAWERMSTEFSALLRGAEKQFHHNNAYHHGEGRNYSYWLEHEHPTAFVVHFERADGGRQDLDFDAAVPLYVNRKYMVDYLNMRVFAADHSNILEDFLYVAYTATEFIAMTRANALISLLISKPLRWLAGSSFKLSDWSPMCLGPTDGSSSALDLVEQFYEQGSTDGSVFLDAGLDIFSSIKQKQPAFAEYIRYTFETEFVLAPDGKTKHLINKLALQELIDPSDVTNQRSRLKTIEYLEVQCKASLKKMHDAKLAIASKLSSQGGAGSAAKLTAQDHADLLGLDATNDRLAEGVFGKYDMFLRRFPGISMEAASALAQASGSKSFAEGGDFGKLPEREAHALIELARTTVREMRAVDRADHAELDAYHAHRRKTNSQLELDALVKQYALALSFFDRWKARGVGFDALDDALAALEMAAGDGEDEQATRRRDERSTQAQLDYLREQIEMRVVGLGFVEFKTPWSSSKDETIGTVASLKRLLEEILMDENARRIDGELPTAAVVPVMKRKSFKELGTPTAQAAELAHEIKALSQAELLALAQEKRAALEAAGEIDELGDVQPEKSPKIDDAFVGSWLEICWRYWRKPTEEEVAAGEKRKKIGVKIWCEGEVTHVANGTTTTVNPESARCKKLANAGAIRIRWPADDDRNEKETFSWHIMQDADWNADRHMGWRFTMSELARRREAAEAAQQAQKERREAAEAARTRTAFGPIRA